MSPALADLWRVFGRIGVMSFGGPAAQIALMHRELVETRNWLNEKQFLDALSFCTLLPGPEAMQLATYAGWRLRGVPGGLIAGLLFVLPGALVILALAAIYAAVGDVPRVEALFLGIKAAVLVVVIEALLKVSKRALKSADRWVIAALTFVALFVFALPYPLIVIAAAAYGALTATGKAAKANRPPLGHILPTIGVWLGLWWAPVAALALIGAERLVAVALFFSKLAVVTFGGAYAVLAYMAQAAVETHGWLTTPEMIDGLGLAETTPGPLILVTEFVGYLAGYQVGGWALGLAAAAITLWVTFVPCFLWIFAGAPFIDWIGTRPRLSGALSAITAAVVGVILNLSLWFALHVAFGTLNEVNFGPVRLLSPDLSTFDWRVPVLAGLAALLLLWRHWPLPLVLAASAAGGLLLAQM